MYTIKIKNGQATRTSWNSDIREYVTEAIDSLVPYLDCKLDIEETTFGQFFRFIEKDVEFYNKAYRSSTYGCPVNPLVKEIQEPLQAGPREWSPRGTEIPKPLSDVDYVEVYWGSDMEDGVINEYPCFHGWGDWDLDGPEAPVKGGIALEFTATNLYQHLPFRLNDEYQIFDEKLSPIFKGRKLFRVHDVIRAILYELTWAGDITNGREVPFKH
jgi:hypothetical protein